MAKENMDRARWAWILALIGGCSYYYAVQMGLQGVSISLWKASGVAFLAVWAACNARGSEYYWIAAALAFGAAGDFLLAEFGLLVGGATFAIGHFIAISFYLRHRRRHISKSQKYFALLVTPLALLLAWLLTRSAPAALMAAALSYTLILGLMTASAWTSRFPRYRTGIGAFIFLLSDLAIFAGEGGAISKQISSTLVWPLYFGGQALIAWGVVTTLAKDQLLPPERASTLLNADDG